MNSIPLAWWGVIFIHIFVGANFAYSLRLAYSHALNLNGGGYPIMGHAIHNLIALWFALLMIGKRDELCWVGKLVFVESIIVPAVQWYLIGRMASLGERRRVETNARDLTS